MTNLALVDLTPYLMGDPAGRPRPRSPTLAEQMERGRSEGFTAKWRDRHPQPCLRDKRPDLLAKRRAWVAECIEAARRFRDRMSNEAQA